MVRVRSAHVCSLVAVAVLAMHCGSSRVGALGTAGNSSAGFAGSSGTSGAGSGGGGGDSAGMAGSSGGGNAGTAGSGTGGSGGLGTAGSGGLGAAGSGQEATSLDVYVMFDVSGSTCGNLAGGESACSQSGGEGCGGPVTPTVNEPSRLSLMTQALATWLDDEQTAAIGVGLGYFGHQCIGQTSCDPAAYSTPLVEIGPLPARAPALQAALATFLPTGETPTGPALRGACSVAEARKAAWPGRNVVLLLITDGEPEAEVSCPSGCCPTLEDAAEAAAECVAEAGLPTYVIALGPSLSALSAVASAGNTVAYFADAAGELPSALAQFRSDALAQAGN